MHPRPFWQKKIEAAWERRNVLWLMGVRRAGKTVLCSAVAGGEYFDCELPRIRRQLEDPESFLRSMADKRVLLDEIHRLPDPAQLLKIAADHYPSVRILATGSSTLGASSRFRDTLVGRKEEIWLTPMVLDDLSAFGAPDLMPRLLRGGLPPFFTAPSVPEREYQSWVDDYWAKDVLALFRLERRASFQRLLELLVIQSGGVFEATKFARPCEVSRTTISNYLAVLEATFIAHVVRPFSRSRSQEVIAAPKVYAFDTGFVCAFRGWRELRPDDLGVLWEHLVLNELQANLQTRRIRYWRSRNGNEVDFVLTPRGKPPIAIECKWSPDGFGPEGLIAFRHRHPGGRNFVVGQRTSGSYERAYSDLMVEIVDLPNLIAAVSGENLE
jgi:predicted AAA+ superfamily ATPase